MTSPTDDDRGAFRGIEKDTEELGDPEASPGIPSASLAAQARRAPSPSALAPERHDSYGEIWRLAWPVIASQMLAYILTVFFWVVLLLATMALPIPASFAESLSGRPGNAALLDTLG